MTNAWIERLATDPLAQRLGWTLVHFLWQGFTIAAVVGVALLLLRRRSSQARYAVLCAGLLAMIVAPVVTVNVLPTSAGPTDTPTVGAAQPSPSTPAPGAPLPPTEDPALGIAWTPTAADTADAPNVEPALPPAPAMGIPSTVEPVGGPPAPWMPWVVTVWTLGVGLLSLWNLWGWLQVQRLRRVATRPVEPNIQAIASPLMQRLRMSGPVRVLESALVGVPTVIGWLRPVILLPASALTGLSAQQLQAILAHELAHIRRHDYLVNLLQAVVETLLFYHPAVWWLSGRLRAEREHCCDDVAVRLCGNTVGYARALTAMAKLHLRPPVPAVAASGGPLLARVRRLLGLAPAEGRKRSCWQAAVLVLGLLAVGLAIGDYAQSGPTEETKPEPMADAPKPKEPEAKRPVWISLLPLSPIRSFAEYHHLYRVQALVKADLQIESCRLLIRRAKDQSHVAHLKGTVALPKGLLNRERFPGGITFGAWEPGRNEVRRLGVLPDGEYRVAVYVNGIRCSNVAKVIIRQNHDPRDLNRQPTLRAFPIEPGPDGKLRYLGICGTGPTPQDAKLTNMSLAFPELVVDGVVRRLNGMEWSGPVAPLQSGQRHQRIIELNRYDPKIDGGKKHTVRARVGKHESAPIVISPAAPLGKAWDAVKRPHHKLPEAKPSVRGTVFGPGGTIVAGYWVYLTRAAGKERLRQVSDSKGRYAFHAVPAGDWTLSACPPGKGRPGIQIEPVTVIAGETVVEHLSFHRKRRFSGRVTYPDGTPAAGQDVCAEWQLKGRTGKFWDGTVTDQQGWYALAVPYPVKSTSLWITGTAPADLKIKGGKPQLGRTDVDIVMPRPKGQLQHIHKLIKQLKHDAAAVRRDSAKALGVLRAKQAVPGLTAAIQDIDVKTRLEVVRALGRIGGERAVDALILAARDEHVGVREEIISVLGRAKDRRAVGVLLEAMESDYTRHRIGAAAALGTMGDRRATKPLIRVLQDDSNDLVRLFAAGALGELRDPAACKALRAALTEDPSMRVRGSVAQALGLLRDKQAVDLLIETVGAGAESPVGSAAAALGFIGDRRAIPALVVVYDRHNTHSKEDQRIRTCVKQALRMIAPREFASDVRSSWPKADAPAPSEADIKRLVTEFQSKPSYAAKDRFMPKLTTHAAFGPHLMALARDSKDDEIRWLSIRGLGYLKFKPATALLVECLKDEHAYVRANAARALGEMKATSAAEALIDALEREKHTGAIEQTSLALTMIGAKQAVPALRKFADHPNMPTRCWVIQAIGKLGSPKDVRFVAGYLDDRDQTVQEMAGRALERLTGQDFGFPKESGPRSPRPFIQRAKQWWNANKDKFPQE